MTNEEKSTKIVENYETKYNDTRDLLWTDLEDVAMEMAAWKDEQLRNILVKIQEESYDWRKQNCRNNASFLDCGQIMRWIFEQINNNLQEKINNMNIFEYAKFGDKFRTKDGKMAIYIYLSNGYDGREHLLAIEDKPYTYGYNDDGTRYSKTFENEDIVSRWEEPIDE